MGCIISNNWSDEDERELNAAAIRAAAGAMFITRKMK
jgi:hypothetical protein